MIYLIVLICTLDVPSTCAAVKRWRQHLEHEVLCRKLLETERRHQQIGLLRMPHSRPFMLFRVSVMHERPSARHALEFHASCALPAVDALRTCSSC